MLDFLKSWKTTIGGIISIGTGVLLIIKGHILEGATAVSTGVGLITAKDANKTGTTKNPREVNK